MLHPHMTEALAEQRRQDLQRVEAPGRRFGRRTRSRAWVKRALRSLGS